MTSRSVLVVADDLTGANATAAGLARSGLRAATIADGARAEQIAEFLERFDAVVVSTNARHAPQDQAAAVARDVVRSGWPVSLVSNRIDSTLRGNVAVTTQAVLEATRLLSAEQRVVALCVPAHPEAGRQTVGGIQLLDGRRLEETELARDPRSPVTGSEVGRLLRADDSQVVVRVGLDQVTGDGAALQGALLDAAQTADLVVCDALTLEHVRRIVEAAAQSATVRWVMVDPGPATAAMAEAMDLVAGHDGLPLLAVSGSATELTRRQWRRVLHDRPVELVRPVLDEAGVPLAEASARMLTDRLLAARPGQLVLMATVLDAEDLVDASGDVGSRIPAALARITRLALAKAPIDGLFATGGDVAAACFDELGAAGLDVTDEVVPLAVSGTLLGGRWSGLPVVTKGGLVGGDDATIECLAALETAVETARRHVPSGAASTMAYRTEPPLSHGQHHPHQSHRARGAST